MRNWLFPQKRNELTREEETPNPAVAFAVGLVYVFRTRQGLRIIKDLEEAVRKYSADPKALWELVRKGEEPAEVIDTTAVETPPLPPKPPTK